MGIRMQEDNVSLVGPQTGMSTVFHCHDTASAWPHWACQTCSRASSLEGTFSASTDSSHCLQDCLSKA